MFKALTGFVPEECEPGWSRIVLRPCFSDRVKEFSAWHNTPMGRVKIIRNGGQDVCGITGWGIRKCILEGLTV